MNATATNVGFPRRRLQTSVFATALTLVTTVGCWEEVRYNPSQEPIQQPSEPVVLPDETPREQLAPAPSVAPSAAQLFAEEPNDEEDPLRDGSETVKAAPTPAEPAPLARIDSPDVEHETAAIPTPADPRTALAAWRMASKWSLAVGVYGKGWQADRYGDMWQQADYAAQLLKVQLPPLPENVAADELLSTATSLLLEEAGPQLAEAVGAEHSAGHRALCNLAIKTHALLLIYTPTDSELESLVAAIRQSAEDSPLPERLWRPFLESLDAGADFQEVKQAIFELHKRATAYLGDLISP